MKLFHDRLKGSLMASTFLIAAPALLASGAIAQESDNQDSGVEEITVQGRYIPDEKRATSEIANVIDADAFSLAGDGDVAVALQRVPGLSLVGGKYVYVRGLGERYSSTLLNNSGIPSPEPLRKVVPLDIFPTSLIESVLVQKTYSPQYPGEFGGGVIDLRTKAVPDDFVLEIGIEGKYNSEATFKDGLSYDGTGSEIFGFGGSRRNIPDEILKDVTLASLTEEEREAAGEALPNIWSIDNETNLPGAGFDFVWGNRYDVGSESAFGFFTAVTYDVNTRHRNGVRRTVTTSDAGPVIRSNFAEEVCFNADFEGKGGDDCGVRQTNMDVSLNGILSVGYEFNNDHSLNFTSTVLRQSTKRSLIEKGLFAQEDSLRTSSTIDWIESQVWANQLSGEHNFMLFGDSDVFQDTVFNWRANLSRSDRDVPLRRNTVYEYNEGIDAHLILARTDGNTTSYNALDEETKEFGFDLEQAMYVADTPVDILAGFTYAEKERSFGLVRYNFAFPSGTTTDLRQLVPEIIFGPVNIDPDGIRLTEIFDPSDFYTASFENVQGYLGADIELSAKMRLAFGVRYEDSTQIVDTVDRTTDEAITVTQDGEYWLPAATFTYEIIDNMQVRLAYSQTIARPDMRELSTAPFIDDERGLTVRGNPELRIAEIENYDARFEWYFAAGESLTVGAFYKKFTNPIEQSAQAFGEGRLITYVNGESAELKGIEVEVEKILFLQDWFGWDWLGSREMFVKANGSYIDGETITAEADLGIVTNPVRSFQGQSEWLANFQLGWRDYDRGENLAIVLNYTGRRLSLLGVFGTPDEFENPPLMLNFAYSKEFDLGGNVLEMKLEAENLLGDEILYTQFGVATEQYDLGRTVSLGFKYKF
jgi:outer membrane receptor protein involved in Fe transport